MAYKRTFWVDHVTDQEGDVLQYSTLLDQEHFNNMEVGISDAGLALALVQFKQMQDGYQYEDKTHMPFSNWAGFFDQQKAKGSVTASSCDTPLYSIACDWRPSAPYWR